MARSYVMRARQQSAAATRTRIVQAAHDLLDRPDGGRLTVQEVAAEAGVSRATIYNALGSRRELLSSVFVDQGRRIGFDSVLRALDLPDPAAAVLAVVRESCRAWAVMPGAIRRTLALAQLDQEVGELVAGYEADRRGRLTRLARRAKRAGVVPPAVSAREAATTLHLVTGFVTFDQLLLDHSAAGATAHLIRLTKRSLLEVSHSGGADAALPTMDPDSRRPT